MGADMMIALANAPYKADGTGRSTNLAHELDEATLYEIKRGRVEAIMG